MIKKLLFFHCFLFVVLSVWAQPKEGIDYIGILKKWDAYNPEERVSLQNFQYQSSNHPELAALRKDFKLDSIAGFGTEVSRLLNILHWVHNTVKHDGSIESGIEEVNARTIITTAMQKGIGVSCGELSTTLNECYLAMGWASRKVYCLPLDSAGNDHDSHVINAVYLSSQKKWIWVDPTHDAYVMDENGELLSIAEVRDRLITGKPMIVNPDANWNHRSSTVKSYYLMKYMAKNLYMLYSPLSNEFGYESKNKQHTVEYVYLVPLNHPKKRESRKEIYRAYIGRNVVINNISNAEWFWKPPVR